MQSQFSMFHQWKKPFNHFALDHSTIYDLIIYDLQLNVQ
ncbi:hypothetical protein NC99_33190 [Sunxiuqinia dokdonensis]|uniref:Uncharacterized protein n=1 Tax=Sunxiuqinia dokdonensis TaxID=1409788 RepID=A0A0L8V643_9BACT|nr:hypothetical protein NC99_33190 [Sunxiuqinia dokdonensis]